MGRAAVLAEALGNNELFTAVVLTAAVGALAAIWLVERALAMTQMLLRWQAQRERIGTVGLAEEVRADVVRARR